MSKKFDEFKAYNTELATIAGISGLLSWDNEVNVPTKGAVVRSQQQAYISGLYHEKSTDKKYVDLIEELSQATDLDESQNINIKKTKEAVEKSTKFTKEFVQKRSMIVSKAFSDWNDAKSKDDFSLFAESLSEIVDLTRESAEIIGYEVHPYDALIDSYEPEMTAKKLDGVFQNVKDQLVPFYLGLLDKTPVDDSCLKGKYHKDGQWDLSIHLLKQMGYDFEAGRQDYSSHPFTIGMHPHDVRVTTRFDENNLSELVWSAIHEGGHALYEQGLNAEKYGLLESTAASLGIHESQSRLYENNVGRSLPYWKANYEFVQKTFPDQFKNVDVNTFYKAINKVEPGVIRVNADEISYHLHILIRYEVEMALLEKTIEVKDLPAFWNEKYKSYLGVDVPSDQLGVLQDVHWSHGGFGYFPTYSLGSFYAAQFYQKASESITGLEAQIEKGDLSQLLSFLRTNIHSKGKLYNSEEICTQTTGEGLNFDYFMNYVKGKYEGIYSF